MNADLNAYCSKSVKRLKPMCKVSCTFRQSPFLHCSSNLSKTLRGKLKNCTWSAIFGSKLSPVSIVLLNFSYELGVSLAFKSLSPNTNSPKTSPTCCLILLLDGNSKVSHPTCCLFTSGSFFRTSSSALSLRCNILEIL